MLTHQLPRYGWEVHVASLRGGVFEEELAPSTIVHRIPCRGERDPRIPFRLAALIGRLRPLLVQTWLTLMDIHGGLAALSRHMTWIATERNSALAYQVRLTNLARALLLPHADALVANSRGGLEIWKRFGARQVQRIIPNAIGIRDCAGAALPAGIDVDDEVPLIVSAGRLSPEKGLRALLRAIAEVRREVPAVAVICGEGPMLDELQATARALSLNGAVIFAGHVKDVAALLRRADVYVSISRVEGSPNAVLEALACGTPLVVSDIPAHRELLDETTARLVAGDDAAAVAAAIVDCLRDREAARSRAAEALRRTALWPPEVVAGEYDALYRQLLAAKETG